MKALREDFPLGRIDPERPVEIGNYRGWEFVVAFEDRMVVQRSYRGHGRDFTLRVSVPRLDPLAPEVAGFFSSFQPVDRPAVSPAAGSKDNVPMRLQGAASEVMALRFSADGELTAVSQNGELTQWQAATGQLLRTTNFSRQPVRFLAFDLGAEGRSATGSSL